MTDLLRILILAPFAYIAALVAATLTLAFSAGAEFGLTPLGTGAVAGYTLMVIGAATFVPCLIAFLLAEFLRIRSIFYFVLFGGVLGFALHRLLPLSPSAEILQQRAVAFAAAGFVGGFVYWAIAGRLSGIGRRGEAPAP